MDKCVKCQFYTTNNMKLVAGKIPDGYCMKWDIDIVNAKRFICSEYMDKKVSR